MKILELTNYSKGICGVWQRVKQESELLSKKGHDVQVFSTNFTKGSEEVAPRHEKIGKIKITRFPTRKMGGEAFSNWDFKKEAKIFKPDIIIAHSYRHPHTTKALKIAKEIGAKVFLVTHAPFDRKDTRSFLSSLIVPFYDKTIGPSTLKQFDKIITIVKWENKYLKKMRIKEDKISYIPNGIPEEFFEPVKEKSENKILFLGRISPIKDLEVLIEAISIIENKKIKLEIVGPAEKEYRRKLEAIVKGLNLSDRIIFLEGIYDLRKKIKKIDASSIFVLPSKSEGMPQGLIEAMARKRVVLASNNQAAKELIQDKKNGFLFRVGNSKDLAEKINAIIKDKKLKRVKENARKSVEKFKWSSVIEKIEELF